jgi:hypothetical protein
MHIFRTGSKLYIHIHIHIQYRKLPSYAHILGPEDYCIYASFLEQKLGIHIFLGREVHQLYMHVFVGCEVT